MLHAIKYIRLHVLEVFLSRGKTLTLAISSYGRPQSQYLHEFTQDEHFTYKSEEHDIDYLDIILTGDKVNKGVMVFPCRKPMAHNMISLPVTLYTGITYK